MTPVSAYNAQYGATLSMLRSVGRSGVPDESEIEVNKKEPIGIARSAEALKAPMKRLDCGDQRAAFKNTWKAGQQ